MRRSAAASTSRRRIPNQKARPRRRAIALALLLGGFASCLSDDPDETGKEAVSLEAEGEQPGPGIAAVTLPPGGIVDTQANSGWTEGAFSVNHDGAATYSLPL